MMEMIKVEKPTWVAYLSNKIDEAVRIARADSGINTVILDGTTMTEQGIAIVREIKALLPKAQFVGFSKDVVLLGKLDAVGCDKVTDDKSNSIFRFIIEE